MPEENQPYDEQSLQAPPSLIEGLRHAQKTLTVPPQYDEAILSRARLHLSRIRPSASRISSAVASESDLPLAAHSDETQERLARRLAPRDESSPIMRRRIISIRLKTLILWGVIAAIVFFLLYLASKWFH